jgi:hypothetical protein
MHAFAPRRGPLPTVKKLCQQGARFVERGARDPFSSSPAYNGGPRTIRHSNIESVVSGEVRVFYVGGHSTTMTRRVQPAPDRLKEGTGAIVIPEPSAAVSCHSQRAPKVPARHRGAFADRRDINPIIRAQRRIGPYPFSLIGRARITNEVAHALAGMEADPEIIQLMQGQGGGVVDLIVRHVATDGFRDMDAC